MAEGAPDLSDGTERAIYEGLEGHTTNVESVARVAQQAKKIAEAAKKGFITDDAGRVINRH